MAHGGYLASQPDLLKRLTSLHRVIKDRASSLQALLSLKGKLDMLEAQMNLRNAMRERSRIDHDIDEDEDDGVIYVEGQEESDSEDDVADVDMEAGPSKDQGHDDSSFSSQEEGSIEEDEALPNTVNGNLTESEGSDAESDGLGIDAASTDLDSDDALDAEEIDHDDVDSVDSESGMEEEIPTQPSDKRAKEVKLPNGIGKRR